MTALAATPFVLPAAAAVPDVSVIMPVYNAGATLAATVDSVLAQSLERLEVVLVDDGSADDSCARARAIARDDPRVRLFRRSANRGQAAARNVALALARGRWIAVVDADDEIGPDRLASLVATGDATGADLVADGLEFAGERRRGTPTRLRIREHSRPGPRLLGLEELLESDVPLTGRCSFGYLKPIMRRSFLDRVALRYDEELRFAEDMNLYARALLAGARFVLHSDSRYVYHQTAVSVTRTGRLLPRVAWQALLNNQRLRELAEADGRADLARLFELHRGRWATVLWFNDVKLALRQGRMREVLRLGLECPTGSRGLLQLARGRTRSGTEVVS